MSLRALVFAVLAAPALLGCQTDAKAQERCAVYRAFFEQLPAPERQAFYSNSQPDMLAFHRVEMRAPTRFERGAGLMAPDPRASPQSFNADTSQYFGQLSTAHALELASCFEGAAPRFIADDADTLALIDGPERAVLSVWSVSPVAISPDGQHALIASGMFCGGLCGSGAYYLFEKSETRWTLLGHHDLWVS